jgi:molybdopterin/thiamine biosynthesis adenylyltransferase
VIAMQPWYERDPARMRTELLAGEGTGAHLHWVRHGDGLVGWQGQVEVKGQQHFLTITYPPTFPMAAPHVLETEPFQSTIVDDSMTYHQFPDGSLCLYTVGRDPRSWSPEYTVADVLARYREYREMASAGQHIDDGEHMAVAGVATAMTLVMTPGQAHAMNMPEGRGRLEIACTPRLLGVIQRLNVGDLDVTMDLASWAPAGVTADLRADGFWVRVSDLNWRSLYTWGAIEALLANTLRAPQLDEALAAPVLVLARRDSSEPGNALVVYRGHQNRAPSTMPASSHVQIVDLEERLFARVDGAMAGRKRLADARVALVGLGSLGSAVAMHLARSGVSQFHLFDPDRLEPENITRHTGDLSALYLPKVSIVEALILRRNPRAQVQSHASSPLWDGSGAAQRQFQEILDHPASLVVVTTADDQVERAINQMAVMAHAPAVYGSVVGAAEHGRIFRVIPGQTACYQCILDAQASEPDRFPSLREARGTERPGVHPYRQPGIPGLGIDVEQVALMTARLALQTLALRLSADIGYPAAHGHHFLWTARGGWAFDHPQQVRVEPYARRASCAVCGAGSQTSPDRDSLAAELTQLVQHLSDPRRMAPDAPTLNSGPGDVPPNR